MVKNHVMMKEIRNWQVLLAVVLLFIFLSCGSGDHTSAASATEQQTEQEALTCEAISRQNAVVSTRLADIPDSVLRLLSARQGEPFVIADSTSIDAVNLTDIHIPTHDPQGEAEVVFGDSTIRVTNKQEYDKLLHYVCKNDSVIFIVYTQGGYASHHVIDLVLLQEMDSVYQIIPDSLSIELCMDLVNSTYAALKAKEGAR